MIYSASIHDLMNQLHDLAKRAKVGYQINHLAGDHSISIAIVSENPAECFMGDVENHPATAYEKAIAFLHEILLRAMYPHASHQRQKIR